MAIYYQLLHAALALLTLYLPLSFYLTHRTLRKFPGPFLAGYSELWLFYNSLLGRLDRAQAEALRQYGSPCRIGPNLLITDDAEVVRRYSAPGSGWTRGGWYEGVKLDPRQESVFSTRDERLHGELRGMEGGAVGLLGCLV